MSTKKPTDVEALLRERDLEALKKKLEREWQDFP